MLTVAKSAQDGAKRGDYRDTKDLVDVALKAEHMFLHKCLTFEVTPTIFSSKMLVAMPLFAFAILQNNRTGNDFMRYLARMNAPAIGYADVREGYRDWMAIDALDAALVSMNREGARMATSGMGHGRCINANGPMKTERFYSHQRIFRRCPRFDMLANEAPRLLHYAYDGQSEAVEMLVELCGAQPGLRDNKKGTIFHAIALGYADTTCYDDLHGDTLRPLEVSEYIRGDDTYPKLWAYFEDLGLNPEFPDANGDTADEVCLRLLTVARGAVWAKQTWNFFYYERTRLGGVGY